MVKKDILKFLIFISFSVCHHPLFSQVITNNGGLKEKHFVYEVKDIDEFFERFNDDPNSFLRGIYKTHHARFDISRKRLIRSLFNDENTKRDSAMMNKFIAEVTKKKKPVFLDFYGGNWYAELTCKFKYNGSFIEIPVILQIELARNKGSKWMIVAVGPSSLKSKNYLADMAQSKNQTNIISPTSHGTNFVSLRRAFDDKANLSGYFETIYLKKSHMLEFYNAVLNHEIEFQDVSKIKYHFLLGDKWIFRVENFQRTALNSGWLINDMEVVNPGTTESYRSKLLSGN